MQPPQLEFDYKTSQVSDQEIWAATLWERERQNERRGHMVFIFSADQAVAECVCVWE